MIDIRICCWRKLRLFPRKATAICGFHSPMASGRLGESPSQFCGASSHAEHGKKTFGWQVSQRRRNARCPALDIDCTASTCLGGTAQPALFAIAKETLGSRRAMWISSVGAAKARTRMSARASAGTGSCMQETMPRASLPDNTAIPKADSQTRACRSWTTWVKFAWVVVVSADQAKSQLECQLHQENILVVFARMEPVVAASSLQLRTPWTQMTTTAASWMTGTRAGTDGVAPQETTGPQSCWQDGESGTLYAHRSRFEPPSC
jgi:hypothetical protein